MLERKEIYGIEEVMAKMPDFSKGSKNELSRKKNHSYDVLFDGDIINLGSLRYETFKKSIICTGCGLKGAFFAKERNVNKNNVPLDGAKYHLNLYALDKDGNEILMTKDHIIPKSRSGKDTIENMQTMCCKCNLKKADSLPESTNIQELSSTILQLRKEIQSLKQKNLKMQKTLSKLNGQLPATYSQEQVS